MDDTGSASAPRREKRRLGKWWRLGHRWGQEGRRDRHRQTDTQTDMQTLRQHPLGASRRPKNHAGFAPGLSPHARTHARAPVFLPQMPLTRSQEPAHRQRQASAAAKEAVSNDLRHTTNDSKQSHAVRCGQDAGGRNTGAESCARAVVVARATSAATWSRPLRAERRRVRRRVRWLTTQPHRQHTTRGSDKRPQRGYYAS